MKYRIKEMTINEATNPTPAWVVVNRYGEHCTGYYTNESDAEETRHRFEYDHGLNEVACIMLHDDHAASESIGSTLPAIAGYSKNLSAAQMVKNRVNARVKMVTTGNTFDKDLVI